MKFIVGVILLFISSFALASSLPSTYAEYIHKNKLLKDIRDIGSLVLWEFHNGYKKNIKNPRAYLGFDYLFDNFEYFSKSKGQFVDGVALANAYNYFLSFDSQFKKHNDIITLREAQAIYVGFILLIKRGKLESLDNRERYDSLSDLIKENLKSSHFVNSTVDRERAFWDFSWRMIYAYFNGFPIDTLMFAQQSIAGYLFKDEKYIEPTNNWPNKLMANFANLFKKYTISKPLNSFWGSKENLMLRVLGQALQASSRLDNSHQYQKILAMLYRKSLELNKSGYVNYYEDLLKKRWLEDKWNVAKTALSNLTFIKMFSVMKTMFEFLLVYCINILKSLTFVLVFQIVILLYFTVKAMKKSGFSILVDGYWMLVCRAEVQKFFKRLFKDAFYCFKEFIRALWHSLIRTEHLSSFEKVIHSVWMVSIGFSATQLDKSFENDFVRYVDFIVESPL